MEPEPDDEERFFSAPQNNWGLWEVLVVLGLLALLAGIVP